MNFSKPRVAVYYFVVPQTNYRNDGAPLYLNYNLRKILDGNTKMNDDTGNVVHLFPLKTAENYGNFDLHIWIDHGEDGLDVPLDWNPPSPSVYWVSDAHLGYDYRLKRAKNFDYVFCCQKWFMDKFELDGIDKKKLFYLPHAVETDVYKPHTIIEKYDWCFIGHLNSSHRVDLMDRMCKEFPNWYLGWRHPYEKGFNSFDDAARKFCQSRVIVSDSVGNDVNMRIFEALGCKRPFVTNSIPEMDNLFTNRKHLFTYNSIDEAVEIVRWALENREEAEKIAECGYNEVVSKHTYYHRALEILEKTVGYKLQEAEHEIKVS